MINPNKSHPGRAGRKASPYRKLMRVFRVRSDDEAAIVDRLTPEERTAACVEYAHYYSAEVTNENQTS